MTFSWTSVECSTAASYIEEGPAVGSRRKTIRIGGWERNGQAEGGKFLSWTQTEDGRSWCDWIQPGSLARMIGFLAWPFGSTTTIPVAGSPGPLRVPGCSQLQSNDHLLVGRSSASASALFKHNSCV